MLSKNQKIGIIIAAFILCLLAVSLASKLYLIKKNNQPSGPSEQEKTVILNKPSSGAENEYQSLIQKYARDTQTLTIGQSCQMDPLVIKFKGDSTLIIANNDSSVHTISFENQNFFNVSPGDKREINIKEVFGLGQGAWRYRCSDLGTEQNVGVMYLSQ